MRLRPTDAFVIAAVTAGLLLAGAAAVVAATTMQGAFVLLDLVAGALEETTLL